MAVVKSRTVLGQSCPYDVHHRLSIVERIPEMTCEKIFQVYKILYTQGFVEPQLNNEAL